MRGRSTKESNGIFILFLYYPFICDFIWTNNLIYWFVESSHTNLMGEQSQCQSYIVTTAQNVPSLCFTPRIKYLIVLCICIYETLRLYDRILCGWFGTPMLSLYFIVQEGRGTFNRKLFWYPNFKNSFTHLLAIN